MDASIPDNTKAEAKSVSSRSSSPESDIDRKSSTDEELPPVVQQFFQSVSQKGFPSAKSAKQKAQPWRSHWSGPQEPEDGKLIVACPRVCTYGSGNLGGY